MEKRQTKQKQLIWSIVDGSFHLTSDEIISFVNKKDSSIGRATIFRALNDFIDEGKIKKVFLDKKIVYDTDIKEHDHFVCSKCGRIIDIKRNHDVIYPDGFKITMASITYYGICDDCI